MDLNAEFLIELRNWIVQLDVNKYEVFGAFFVALVFWRLPSTLKFMKEITALTLNNSREKLKIEAKLERERIRRNSPKGKQ